jgi:hypothetical protein
MMRQSARRQRFKSGLPTETALFTPTLAQKMDTLKNREFLRNKQQKSRGAKYGVFTSHEGAVSC